LGGLQGLKPSFFWPTNVAAEAATHKNYDLGKLMLDDFMSIVPKLEYDLAKA
jgi:hypothetical protein